MIKRVSIIVTAVMLSACVSFPSPPEPTHTPAIFDETIVSTDGVRLPVSVWKAQSGDMPVSTPKAVIIALHGMNDYANAFTGAAQWWAENAQFTTYAVDQRGFGRGDKGDPLFGLGKWPGAEVLRADLRAVIAAVKAAHPETPVYLIGHSMGGAVALSAAAETPLEVEGVILAAPAVWGGSQLPLPYRFSANLAATIAPGKTLTGARAGRQATDNLDILYAMGSDPFVLKETRVDAVLGVVRLMGEAFDATDEVGGDILFLYGGKDEIIPEKPIKRAMKRLCGDLETRVYENGWHLLFRDLQAGAVWRDVAAWIAKKNAAGSGKGMAPAAFICSDTNDKEASGFAAPPGSGEGAFFGE